MCVCVLCIFLSRTSVKGQATAVDTSYSSSPLVISAPELLQSLCLFFQTQLPRTRGEQERGQAPGRRGVEGKKGGNRVGGSEDFFVRSSSCMLELQYSKRVVNTSHSKLQPLLYLPMPLFSSLISSSSTSFFIWVRQIVASLSASLESITLFGASIRFMDTEDIWCHRCYISYFIIPRQICCWWCSS